MMDKYARLFTAIAEVAAMAERERETMMDYQALAIAGFWKDCYPILAQMTYNLVPGALFWSGLFEKYPFLSERLQELNDRAVQLKREVPNESMESIITAIAEDMAKGSRDGKL